MDGVFVIGLPKQLRARLEGAARRDGVRISSVVADLGKKGTLQLLPDPSDAVHSLRAYYDQFSDNFDDAFIIALPYAPIPQDVNTELLTLEELGAEVLYVTAGHDNWPALQNKTRPDTRFHNEVFDKLIVEIFGEENIKPSDYFRTASQKISRIIITDGALDACDQVPDHRHKFIKEAAEAFVELVDRNGRVGRLDVFFREHGLDHAQTGGINTTLELKKGNTSVYCKTSNTHLKQGDNTTPQAAARIYYHEVFLGSDCYIVILYAGPHPENDISRTHTLPP